MDIAQEMCDIDDEQKGIYLNRNTVCICILKKLRR